MSQHQTQFKDDEVEASRIAALLSLLQSWDYVAESLSQHAIGERAGWTLVTLLEAWKAACRLRLLSYVKKGRLLCSFAPNQPQEEWASVVRRLGDAAAPPQGKTLRERLGGGGLEVGNRYARKPNSSEERSALWLMRAGELLHVLQPVAYLGLILMQRRRQQRGGVSGWLAARRPWLVALALEFGGVQLCSLAMRRLEQQDLLAEPGGLFRRPIVRPDVARENARELRHRKTLLKLFILRPAARAVARRCSPPARSGGGQGRLARWCAAALDLIEMLESACWARYFRFQERPSLSLTLDDWSKAS